jgi:hypothetical protein
MRKVCFVVLACFLFGHTAAAEPAWSQISFSTTASSAPKVLAAADKLMSSEVGKTFPGKLLLQANTADGSNPATHAFAPIFKSVADREAFGQRLQASPVWTEFLGVLEKETEPGGTVLWDVVKSWGDINDTDDVWMGHAFNVSDAAKLLAALDKLMASETGQKFPGQVYLSVVIAGGISPVSHTISVGYDSQAEMAAWLKVRNASKDWTAYVDATGPEVAEYLGGSMASTLKTWGPATLKELSAP